MLNFCARNGLTTLLMDKAIAIPFSIEDSFIPTQDGIRNLLYLWAMILYFGAIQLYFGEGRLMV